MSKSLKDVLTSIADQIRHATHEDPNAETIENKMSLGAIDEYFLGHSYNVVRQANFQAGISEGIGIGYQTGFDEGEATGFDDGFVEGWLENETNVIGGLENSVQKVENYTSVECEANDSGGIIQYIDENLPKVYENGKKFEHNRFWDSILNNGSRTSFLYGFSGQCWTAETFVPNRDIIVKNGNNMFMYSRMKIDLVEHFKNIGRTIDFTQNAGWNNTFSQSYFTRVGKIDARKVTTLTSTFAYTIYLETIDKIILNSDGSQSFSNTFEAARALRNIVIEGVIGNDINFQWSPLSKESIINIINALGANKTGKTLTLGESMVADVFGSVTSEDWLSLINSKANWNISLI